MIQTKLPRAARPASVGSTMSSQGLLLVDDDGSEWLTAPPGTPYSAPDGGWAFVEKRMDAPKEAVAALGSPGRSRHCGARLEPVLLVRTGTWRAPQQVVPASGLPPRRPWPRSTP